MKKKWKAVLNCDKSQRSGASQDKNKITPTKNAYTPTRKHKKTDSSTTSISQITSKFPHFPVYV
jgi:hypothetical protein